MLNPSVKEQMPGKNHEPGDSEPVLVANFDLLRQTPNKDLYQGIKNLPPLFRSQEDLSQSFQDALDGWLEVYDPKQCAEALSHLENPDSKKVLKRIRRFGLILKAHYKWFDNGHLAPSLFNQFLKLLGEQNDYFDHENRETLAQNILSSGILDELAKMELKFEPASIESFRQTLKDRLGEILDLAQSETLSTPAFHALRKRIRNLSNLLQSPAARNLGSPVHDLFLIFYQWSTEMGELHDEVVQENLDDRSKYEASQIAVPPDIRVRLESVMNSFRRAVGLSITKERAIRS